MKIEKKVSVLSNKAEQFTVTIPKEIVYRMNFCQTLYNISDLLPFLVV